MAASLLRFASIAFVFSSAASSELARGWGETIQWTAFADAHALAREQNKPIMVSTRRETAVPSIRWALGRSLSACECGRSNQRVVLAIHVRDGLNAGLLPLEP
jgi:hypothetical protein